MSEPKPEYTANANGAYNEQWLAEVMNTPLSDHELIIVDLTQEKDRLEQRIQQLEGERETFVVHLLQAQAEAAAEGREMLAREITGGDESARGQALAIVAMTFAIMSELMTRRLANDPLVCAVVLKHPELLDKAKGVA